MRKRGAIFVGLWCVVVALLVTSAVLIVRGRGGSRAAPGDDAPATIAERSPAPPPVGGVGSPVAPVPPPVARPPTVRHEPQAKGAPDEAELLVRLRELVVSDPALAIQLARDANARTPSSPDAPERNWIVVKSLANLQRFHEARDEAQTMVNRYPGTSWALDVQRHLLSNPLD